MLTNAITININVLNFYENIVNHNFLFLEVMVKRRKKHENVMVVLVKLVSKSLKLLKLILNYLNLYYAAHEYNKIN